MRIAQISPLIESVPPKLYGGTERVVCYLSDALVALGHDVTLFASGDSITTARLAAVWPRALRLDGVQDQLAPYMVMLEQVARRAREFDVIHQHCDYVSYPVLHRTGVPFLTTMHLPMDRPELPRLYETFADVPLVSVSNAQREPLPVPNFIDTVYHGMPERLLLPGSGAGGYLAFLGRIAPSKGPGCAIRIAARTGMRLKIAAKVDKVDQIYFKTEIEPLLAQPHVEYIGEIDDSRKGEFLGNAAGLIFPIQWREPFGLAMIEAMACGTPVIAFRKGSVPEVVDEGVTGFVVDDEDAAVAAAGRLGDLDRGSVRAVFEQRFTARRMAQDYLRLYRALLAGGNRGAGAPLRLGTARRRLSADSKQ
jgi:glycosyltransferase involved in cell wall biosynthesis